MAGVKKKIFSFVNICYQVCDVGPGCVAKIFGEKLKRKTEEKHYFFDSKYTISPMLHPNT